ncbi:MAG: hypothetical protein SFU86_04855 [Pirellulaceae bacterium]|nr:hypothetical protein [Pirellulaceae bacterium]
MSYAENRAIGVQALTLGLPPLIGGVVLCVLGLLTFAWNRPRTNGERSPVANPARDGSPGK